MLQEISLPAVVAKIKQKLPEVWWHCFCLLNTCFTEFVHNFTSIKRQHNINGVKHGKIFLKYFFKHFFGHLWDKIFSGLTLQFCHHIFRFNFPAELSNWFAPSCNASARLPRVSSFSSRSRTALILYRIWSVTYSREEYFDFKEYFHVDEEKLLMPLVFWTTYEV